MPLKPTSFCRKWIRRFHLVPRWPIPRCSCTILTCRKTIPYQNATRHEPTMQVWLALLRYPRDVTTLQVINSLTRTPSTTSAAPHHPTECLSTLQSVASCARQQFSACNIFTTSSPSSRFGKRLGNYTVKNRWWRLPRRVLSLPITFPRAFLLRDALLSHLRDLCSRKLRNEKG